MVAVSVQPPASVTHKQRRQRAPWIDQSRIWQLPDLATVAVEDGFRYEIIGGDLIVTPAPGRPHGIVASLLDSALRAVLETV